MLLIHECPVCARAINRQIRDRSIPTACSTCVNGFETAAAISVAGVDQGLALWRYDESVAPLITAAKRFGGSRTMASLATPLAERIRPFLQSSTVLTWVPPSPVGRRKRGFDQGRLLAEGAATELGVRSAPAFRRSGRAQYGRDRSIRLAGPRLRLRGDWVRRYPTDQVVLVDDVITTGSSMGTAAQLLRQGRSELDIIGAALAVRV